ncbi:Glutathione-regulated potassium-efflux system protein KefC [Vibrio stylophorae]|uniref:Glutathione-regulated potassium-efflux system protein KefC n=1 Tax=Vibrio stylophorae TaxID=659351 RepID=A0ABM8ZUA5_9VIBR|nr:cation:proton antiporter family protein [Vibrio stylophorae]CAH0533902.1 Glutathione-regulated potassium-efflux system protein KefC [Vibrio stylophorae]
MELVLISVAFSFGWAAQRCLLPPLVGFLVAGFVLHALGYQSTTAITTLSDLGVILLLFTIGLKLDVKSLLSKEIWGGATLHNLLSSLWFILALMALKWLGLTVLHDLSLGQISLLAFALSFSSTVFAVKSLEEKGGMNATYGKLAIGVLIMQDIFAVLFLTASKGEWPQWYAFALLALPLIRPLLYRLFDQVGHGEMLVLFAMFLALVVGAGLFELVGLKGDLGALILGILLSGHARASEMSKSLFNLKELFLICFFLNIGLEQTPTWTGLGIAALLMLLLPVKGAIYYGIFYGFKFRIRTTLLATLSLFNFSEFGLIVTGLAYKQGWLPGEMMVVMAFAVSLSFILAAPINQWGSRWYRQHSGQLKEWTPEQLHYKDKMIDLGKAEVLVLGMGRVGTGAYDEITQYYGNIAIGVDIRRDTIESQTAQGRNVIRGDASDSDFWDRIFSRNRIRLVLVAMPNQEANQQAIEQLRHSGFTGKVAAVAKYADDIESLTSLGADAVFNIYREAGGGFARDVLSHFGHHIESPKI